MDGSRNEFLAGGTIATAKERKRAAPTPRKGAHGLAAGIVADWTGGLREIAPIDHRPGFPVYYPGHRLGKAHYVEDPPRVYDIYEQIVEFARTQPPPPPPP